MNLLKSILPTYFTCVPCLFCQCDNAPFLADSFPLFDQKLYETFDWKTNQKQIRNNLEGSIYYLLEKNVEKENTREYNTT